MADPRPTPQKLFDDGWRQISRKYRLIARLPEGKTGKQALYDGRIESLNGVRLEHWTVRTRTWVNVLGEYNCADHYRRCYAQGDLRMELDAHTFSGLRMLVEAAHRRGEV